jgi:hypothetical protein
MINKTITIVLFIIFLMLPLSLADTYQSQINAPVAPDSLPSSNSFETDLNSGAATFTYPIQVPPGTNGLQPNLAFMYNSNNRNSYPELVGSGWSLTQSYIQRDVEHTPADTSDDTFILVFEGGRHKLVYDSNDQKYHTNPESFLSIVKVSGGSNEKNEYWEVSTKDGTTFRFG